jgi:diadenosine tetraphosphate (Ap4A) HIT family hydrolase
LCYKSLSIPNVGILEPDGFPGASTEPWMTSGCLFCSVEGGQRLWGDDRCRAVLTAEPFPGFCRVIWHAHVAEMTDLAPAERNHLMQVVYALEAALRARLAPAKMNLAALGNQTPHLHWHVIPRFADDSHFPQPVWGSPQRPGRERVLPDNLATALAGDLVAVLGPAGST